MRRAAIASAVEELKLTFQQMADENRQFFTRLAQLPTIEKQSIKVLAKSSNQQQLEGESRASNVESQLRSCLLKDTSPEVNNEVPNLEFPSFDGVNPRNWIRQCSRYFSLYNIPESQRVEVASIHFTGRAAAWFANYSVVRKNVDWCDFILDVCTCFKEELGVTRQPNSGSGNPPLGDAPQVLDKSPKSNPDISSHGWVGEGQGKSPVGSQNAFGGQLDRLNPSNGLFEKSTSCIHDPLTFNVQGQPQGNAQPFPAEWRKLIASTRCDDGKNTQATGICCADEAALWADMEIGEEFYMPAGYSKVLGLKSVVPELQDPNQGKKHWIPKKPEWKAANGFCELVFDPGILGNHVRGAARRSEVSPGNARLPFKEQMPSKTSISRMEASCSNITNVDKVSLVENSGAVDADFKAERGSSLCTSEDVNMEGKSLPKELNLQNRSSETCDACAVETETETNKGADNASSEVYSRYCASFLNP